MKARTNHSQATHDPHEPRWRGACRFCGFVVTARTAQALFEAQVDHDAFDTERFRADDARVRVKHAARKDPSPYE